ncbi:MAG TPA: hypothetical protein PLC48_12735, partial [Ferruginibacter sp.]|nr:hypothetical protein [Ferruginibacter sp.]
MKKCLYLLGLMLMISANGLAQKIRLEVAVVNDKQEPFQNATASLFQMPDSVLKSKKLIKGKEFFEVDANSNYLLQVTATGTSPFYRNILIG